LRETTVVSTTATLINHTIGNYRVTSLLGEGGMGVVYLAQHPVFGRKVAIKLLHAVLARDADIVARFFNEARAIHMVAHENIVEILDFGQTPDGQPYFIMEYLSGESLSDAIARGPMATEQVEAIGVQMCKALGAAHGKGIVHRDLKPHNVQLVIKADGALQVKILDFGVAKILASPDGTNSVKTRTGSLMGTPLYMSPEQCKGAGVLDHRTDIYSLGVILFEMLSGRPPFTAEGVGELFAKHMLEDPPMVTEFAPNAPPHMAAAIMKALAKDDRASVERAPSQPRWRDGEHDGADDLGARVDHAVVGVVRDRRCGAGDQAEADEAVRRARRRRGAAGRRFLRAVGQGQGQAACPYPAPDRGRHDHACRAAAYATAAHAGEEDRHHSIRGGTGGRARVP
jgi:serine/threonine protein kinase